MALQTIAELTSDVFLGLAEPQVDICSPEDCVRAVMRSLTYYQYELSQSSENQVVKHVDFTPANRTWQITGADINTPLWVERQVMSGMYESWQFVPSVNLAMLEDSRLRGDMRCSFFGENSAMFVKLSYNAQLLPYRRHRLYFDPAPLLAQTLNSTALGTLVVGIPLSFSPMITVRAIKTLLPLMLTKAASSENPPSKDLITAWAALLADAKDELAVWGTRWKSFCFGSRDGQRGRRRRQIIAQGGVPTSWPGYR